MKMMKRQRKETRKWSKWGQWQCIVQWKVKERTMTGAALIAAKEEER